ncbi:hypothetical protein [Ferdinandcohnia sp. Marseille-Q9671]
MVKRKVGISFIAISTILIVIKMVSDIMLGREVGSSLITSSLFALLVGMIYLAWGESEKYKRNKGK